MDAAATLDLLTPAPGSAWTRPARRLMCPPPGVAAVRRVAPSHPGAPSGARSFNKTGPTPLVAAPSAVGLAQKQNATALPRIAIFKTGCSPLPGRLIARSVGALKDAAAAAAAGISSPIISRCSDTGSAGSRFAAWIVIGSAAPPTYQLPAGTRQTSSVRSISFRCAALLSLRIDARYPSSEC